MTQFLAHMYCINSEYVCSYWLMHYHVTDRIGSEGWLLLIVYVWFAKVSFYSCS